MGAPEGVYCIVIRDSAAVKNLFMGPLRLAEAMALWQNSPPAGPGMLKGKAMKVTSMAAWIFALIPGLVVGLGATIQSHAMADVGCHYSNLWFAAQQKTRPLAAFYFMENRSHLNWAVRARTSLAVSSLNFDPAASWPK